MAGGGALRARAALRRQTLIRALSVQRIKACALRMRHAGCALLPGAGGRAGPDLHHTNPDCKRFMV